MKLQSDYVVPLRKSIYWLPIVYRRKPTIYNLMHVPSNVSAFPAAASLMKFPSHAGGHQAELLQVVGRSVTEGLAQEW